MFDAGIELQLQSVDVDQGTGVFLQTRAAFAGGSGNFGDVLGLATDRRRFGYGGLSTGILLGGKYALTASRTLVGPRSLRDVGWQVGVTIIRGPDR